MRKKNSITVFAPASVSNVGPGFDVLGFALEKIGEELTLSLREDNIYELSFDGAELPVDPLKNVATVAIRSLCQQMGYDKGFDIHIKKNFTPGSGLGSSASSAVGAVYAVNELMEWGLSKEELIPHALNGELIASGGMHADNIAPSMLGGFVGVVSCEPFDAFQIPFPTDLKVMIFLPNVVVKTSEARNILPETYPLSVGIRQWANMGGLVTGLITSNYERIKTSLTDEIATPYRQQLIPGFSELHELVISEGALGCNISGSGPAIFSFFRETTSTHVLIDKAKTLFQDKGIAFKVFETKINTKGVEVI